MRADICGCLRIGGVGIAIVAGTVQAVWWQAASLAATRARARARSERARARARARSEGESESESESENTWKAQVGRNNGRSDCAKPNRHSDRRWRCGRSPMRDGATSPDAAASWALVRVSRRDPRRRIGIDNCVSRVRSGRGRPRGRDHTGEISPAHRVGAGGGGRPVRSRRNGNRVIVINDGKRNKKKATPTGDGPDKAQKGMRCSRDPNDVSRES